VSRICLVVLCPKVANCPSLALPQVLAEPRAGLYAYTYGAVLLGSIAANALMCG
jgi:hypothetical protein